MSHSPTIEKYKSLFFLSFKDIKLMYYTVNNDAIRLHQTNDDINTIYQKYWLTMIANNLFRQCLQVKCIIFPMFTAENKLSIQI